NQCIVGYNSKGFDNEFIRFLFYRNLMPPYEWSYQNGNSCFDIYDLVLLGYSFDRLGDLCPPDDGTEGRLKLEVLARHNGLIHEESHNATSDVLATLQLARLLRERCPKLFEYAQGLRAASRAETIYAKKSTFLLANKYAGYERNLLCLVEKICDHPTIQRSRIAWDCRHDPRPILDLSP